MIDDETIATYDRQAETYAEKFQNASSDPALAAFVSRLKPNGCILDLGCGPAAAAAFMRDNGFDVDAVDASQEMVRLANETHNIGARQATFDDIQEVEAYDGIWANFSLLHASAQKFPLHLAALYRALRPGGYFHIGMKLGAGSKRDSLGRYYTFYSQPELCALITNAGFVIDETTTGKDAGLAGTIDPWIVLAARKQPT